MNSFSSQGQSRFSFTNETTASSFVEACTRLATPGYSGGSFSFPIPEEAATFYYIIFIFTFCVSVIFRWCQHNLTYEYRDRVTDDIDRGVAELCSGVKAIFLVILCSVYFFAQFFALSGKNGSKGLTVFSLVAFVGSLWTVIRYQDGVPMKGYFFDKFPSDVSLCMMLPVTIAAFFALLQR